MTTEEKLELCIKTLRKFAEYDPYEDPLRMGLLSHYQITSRKVLERIAKSENEPTRWNSEEWG